MSAALVLGRQAWLSARILWGAPIVVRFRGMLQALLAALLLVAMASWNPADPSLNAASTQAPTNWLGGSGAVFADIAMQSLGLTAWIAALLTGAFGLASALGDALQQRLKPTPLKALTAVVGVLVLAAALSSPTAPAAWPLATGLGGIWGDAVIGLTGGGIEGLGLPGGRWIVGALFAVIGLWAIGWVVGLRVSDLSDGG
ncbi:MAG: DNA translocase FtsK 4TM domain-containing protein [Caulobacterales bacterium]|nr:DNA translocase FtsK 4TM domain-containing protein [Caulobacterales bacterium]